MQDIYDSLVKFYMHPVIVFTPFITKLIRKAFATLPLIFSLFQFFTFLLRKPVPLKKGFLTSSGTYILKFLQI